MLRVASNDSKHAPHDEKSLSHIKSSMRDDFENMKKFFGSDLTQDSKVFVLWSAKCLITPAAAEKVSIERVTSLNDSRATGSLVIIVVGIDSKS